MRPNVLFGLWRRVFTSFHRFSICYISTVLRKWKFSRSNFKTPNLYYCLHVKGATGTVWSGSLTAPFPALKSISYLLINTFALIDFSEHFSRSNLQHLISTAMLPRKRANRSHVARCCCSGGAAARVFCHDVS